MASLYDAVVAPPVRRNRLADAVANIDQSVVDRNIALANTSGNGDFVRSIKSANLGFEAGDAFAEADNLDNRGEYGAATLMRQKGGDLQGMAQVTRGNTPTFGDVLDGKVGLGGAIDYAQGAMGQGVASFVPVIKGAAAGALAGGAAGFLSPVPGGLAAGATLGAGVGAYGAGANLMAGEAAAEMAGDPTIMANTSAGDRILARRGIGAVGGLIDVLPVGRAASQIAKPFLKDAGQEAVKMTLGKAGKELATNMALEGTTEALQGITTNTGLAMMNPDREIIDGREIAENFTGGALGGTALAAPVIAAQYVGSKTPEKKEAKLLEPHRKWAGHEGIDFLEKPQVPGEWAKTASDEDLLNWQAQDDVKRTEKANKVADGILKDKDAPEHIREAAAQFKTRAASNDVTAWGEFANVLSTHRQATLDADKVEAFGAKVGEMLAKGANKLKKGEKPSLMDVRPSQFEETEEDVKFRETLLSRDGMRGLNKFNDDQKKVISKYLRGYVESGFGADLNDGEVVVPDELTDLFGEDTAKILTSTADVLKRDYGLVYDKTYVDRIKEVADTVNASNSARKDSVNMVGDFLTTEAYDNTPHKRWGDILDDVKKHLSTNPSKEAEQRLRTKFGGNFDRAMEAFAKKYKRANPVSLDPSKGATNIEDEANAADEFSEDYNLSQDSEPEYSFSNQKEGKGYFDMNGDSRKRMEDRMEEIRVASGDGRTTVKSVGVEQYLRDSGIPEKEIEAELKKVYGSDLPKAPAVRNNVIQELNRRFRVIQSVRSAGEKADPLDMTDRDLRQVKDAGRSGSQSIQYGRFKVVDAEGNELHNASAQRLVEWAEGKENADETIKPDNTGDYAKNKLRQFSLGFTSLMNKMPKGSRILINDGKKSRFLEPGEDLPDNFMVFNNGERRITLGDLRKVDREAEEQRRVAADMRQEEHDAKYNRKTTYYATKDEAKAAAAEKGDDHIIVRASQGRWRVEKQWRKPKRGFVDSIDLNNLGDMTIEELRTAYADARDAVDTAKNDNQREALLSRMEAIEEEANKRPGYEGMTEELTSSPDRFKVSKNGKQIVPQKESELSIRRSDPTQGGLKQELVAGKEVSLDERGNRFGSKALAERAAKKGERPKKVGKHWVLERDVNTTTTLSDPKTEGEQMSEDAEDAAESKARTFDEETFEPIQPREKAGNVEPKERVPVLRALIKQLKERIAKGEKLIEGTKDKNRLKKLGFNLDVLKGKLTVYTEELSKLADTLRAMREPVSETIVGKTLRQHKRDQKKAESTADSNEMTEQDIQSNTGQRVEEDYEGMSLEELEALDNHLTSESTLPTAPVAEQKVDEKQLSWTRGVLEKGVPAFIEAIKKLSVEQLEKLQTFIDKQLSGDGFGNNVMNRRAASALKLLKERLAEPDNKQLAWAQNFLSKNIDERDEVIEKMSMEQLEKLHGFISDQYYDNGGFEGVTGKRIEKTLTQLEDAMEALYEKENSGTDGEKFSKIGEQSDQEVANEFSEPTYGIKRGDVRAVPQERLTPSSYYGQRIGGIFGKRVIYIERQDGSSIGFDGVSQQNKHPGVIFVDAHSEKSPRFIVGHELLHHLEKSNKVLFSELKVSVGRLIDKKELTDLISTFPEERFEGEGVEEAIANLVGDFVFRNILPKNNEARADILLSEKHTKGSRSARFSINIEETDKLISKFLNANRKFSHQNVGPDVTVTPEVEKEVRDYVERVLGPKFKVLFEKMGFAGKWSPKGFMKIATTAMNPLGTAHHEALHELFKRLKDGGDTRVLELLNNLSNNKIVRRRLEQRLSENPKALAQLKDPEEFAAYAYQFWATEGMEFGDKAKGVFAKIKDFIKRALGMLTEDQKAEQIFMAFSEGMAADGTKDLTGLANRMDETSKFWKETLDKFDSVKFKVDAMFSTVEGRMVGNENPHIDWIGRAFSTVVGEQGQGHIQKVRQKIDQMDSALKRHIEKTYPAGVEVDQEDVRLAMEAMQKGITSSDQQVAKIQAQLNLFFEKAHEYLKTAGVKVWDDNAGGFVDIGYIKNFFPRVWDTTFLQEHGDEFVADLLKEHGDQLRMIAKQANKEVATATTPSIYSASYEKLHTQNTTPVTEEDVARAILNRIISSNGHPDVGENDSLGYVPFMRSINKRTLNWIDNKKFAKYQQKDFSYIMSSYIRQAVKRGEYVRDFGLTGEKLSDRIELALDWEINKLMDERLGIKDAMKKARAEAAKNKTSWSEELEKLGGDPEKVKEITMESAEKVQSYAKGVQAMEGTLGHDANEVLKQLNSYAVVYQNVRLLAGMLFSQVIDPIGVIVNGGTVNDAFKTFTTGVRSTLAHWKGDKNFTNEAIKLAEYVGTIDVNHFHGMMGDMYASQFMSSGAKKINDWFFRAIGAESYNRGVRAMATQVGRDAIERWVASGDATSKRRLEEYYGKGVKPRMKNGKIDLDNYPNDPVASREVEANRVALMRFVDDSILRPNAAQRPTWASDPTLQIFFHMKSFAYAMHRVTLKRAWHEYKNGNNTPMIALAAGYVPVMIAADMLRAMIMNIGDEPEWLKDMGPGEILTTGIARAGLLGARQFGADAIFDPASVFGPSVEQAYDAVFKDETFGKTLAKALPANNIIRGATGI